MPTIQRPGHRQSMTIRILDTGNLQLSGIQDTVQFVIMSIFRDFLVSGTPVIGGYPVSGTLEIGNYPVSWTPDSHFKT